MYLIYEYIGLIILTLLLIHVFYYAFKMNWPQLYFSTDDQFSFYISTTPQRYIAFRLLPVFVIISVLFGINRIPNLYNAGLLGFFIGIVHSILTNFTALIKIRIHSKSVANFRNKPTQVLIHVVSIISISITGTIAGIFSTTTPARMLIPTQQGLIDNIWSSILTALFVIFFYKIYESNRISENIVFQNTLEMIPVDVIKFIDEYSSKNNADNNLIKAIAIVESLERPLWFRRLEYFKSIFIRHGSYGIMQIKSNIYLNDIESVKLAIDKYFKNTPKISSSEDINKIIQDYNKNIKYIDSVIRAYNHLSPINF